jgi:hypothetical protein
LMVERGRHGTKVPWCLHDVLGNVRVDVPGKEIRM